MHYTLQIFVFLKESFLGSLKMVFLGVCGLPICRRDWPRIPLIHCDYEHFVAVLTLARMKEPVTLISANSEYRKELKHSVFNCFKAADKLI